MDEITPDLQGWVYNPLTLHVADSQNRFVCDVEGEILHGREDQIGLLIAAAPRMLSSLRRLSLAARSRDNTMGDPCSLLDAKQELAAAAQEAAEAIVLATPHAI